MNKAIFLDRDGTINEDVNYLTRTEDIRIFPDTSLALQNFKRLGFLNIIITNQSGIARGFFTEEDLNKINEEILKQLGQDKELVIDDIYFSPYHTDGIIEKYSIQSDERKPGTGMILKAQTKHCIDLKESYFIGDSFTDMQCADKAGLKKILVSTGNGKNEYQKCISENILPDFFAKDIYEASQYITQLHNK